MNPQEIQQVTARDEKWVPSTERVKTSPTNVRLETTVHQKEETFQVIIDVIKNSTCFKAFTISAEVPESLCSSSSTVSRRKILDICPRVEGEEFTMVQDDDATLTFITDLGHKDTAEATVDVSEESDPEPARKRTASRRVIEKKVTISAADNIIPGPDIALELGKSISLTKAAEEEAARQVYATHARIVTESISEPARRRTSGIAIRDTSQVSKKVSFDPSQKLKGILCKLSKKARKLVDDSLVLKAQVKELVGHQGFPMSLQSALLPQWGSEQESEYSEEDQRDDDETIEWVDTNEEKEKKDDDDDKIIDLEQTGDEEIDDEFVHGEEHMTNAEVEESGNGDEENIDAAKTDAGNTEEVKDDAKKAELPPTSSSLSVSSGFGDQFLKLSSDTSLIGAIKDTTDAEINSLLDIKIQSEVSHNQSPSVLTIPVLVISEPFVLTPIPKTPLVAPVTTLLTPSFVSTIPPIPHQSTAPILTQPITTDAPTITIVVPESNALTNVQLRVTKLEKDVFELKKMDHFAEALATLKSQVPIFVEHYLGSKIGNDLQKSRPATRLIRMYGYQSTDEYYVDYDYWNTWVQDESTDEEDEDEVMTTKDEVMTTKDDDLLFYQDTFPVDKFVPFGKAMGSKRIEKKLQLPVECGS
ncbi:hypothetical protein Tco_1193540 [Tanacetum coccineum]